MSNQERLIYMANQIARNLETIDSAKAVAATAGHITKFWDPRMRGNIIDALDQPDAGLGDIARQAVMLLRDARA
ncbi:MAG: hypothetical protein ABS87_10260 [Sphingomonas sp. SCN 67-18]|nr:MAG: hypothetical protein ABS87_10260 [Sphingomonas sp. SCN 67-18]